MALLVIHTKGDIRMDIVIRVIRIAPIGVMIDMVEVNQEVIIVIISVLCLLNYWNNAF